MFKATQDLNLSTMPRSRRPHIILSRDNTLTSSTYIASLRNAKYLSRYWNVKVNYLLVLLKDAVSLPTSTLLFSYQCMWFTIVHDNGTYGTIRRCKDVIFDNSYIYDPEVDNSPSEEAFAAIIEDCETFNRIRCHLLS